MAIRAVLMDIDDTLFDFQTSSRQALAETMQALGLPFSGAIWELYSKIDTEYWQSFERGQITKERLYIERFSDLFAALGVSRDAAACNAAYFRALGEQRNFMPHCEQTLRLLHARYPIYILTNGHAQLQKQRIAASGMAQYFDRVFISELLGCKKPDRAFFDRVFAELGEDLRPDSIMIGDSLSSDMQGGRNAGIRTCFYGSRARADARCDYVVEDLLELPALLETL